MGTPLSVDSIGGAISVSHLDLTPEESVVLNRLTEQALAEEDKVDFYGEDYSPPEWYGKQHGVIPTSFKIAPTVELQNQTSKQYAVVPKDNVQSKILSRDTVYKVYKKI